MTPQLRGHRSLNDWPDATARPPIEPRRVVVLLLPHVHLLDLSGPVQTFYEARELGAPYELHHCAETPRVRTAQGLVLADLAPLPVVTERDLVLVPGIDSARLDTLDRVPVAWLRRAQESGARVGSICSGAFVLARAGLLDGRSCTTHWKTVERLQREHPKARVLTNRLFVADGNVITSAGEASGIDMALAILEADCGPLMVGRVAREMVVYLRRSGESAQESVYLDHRTHLHPGIHRVQDWLVANPDRNPTLDELGRLAAMSPRNLTRTFRRATGITLKAFRTRIALQVARDLLANPELTVSRIAESCGFADARQLRRLWKESFGTPLTESRWRDRGAGPH